MHSQLEDDLVSDSKYVVAIVGGATAGAEAARVLAGHGVEVVVFEQNKRPFGKIEDGLPRWHAKQRAKEYVKISDKLKTDGVTLVPHSWAVRKTGVSTNRPISITMRFGSVARST